MKSLVFAVVVVLALSSVADACVFARMRERRASRAGGGCGAATTQMNAMPRLTSGGSGCAGGSCTLRR